MLSDFWTEAISRHAGVGKRPAKSLAGQGLEYSDWIFPTGASRRLKIQGIGDFGQNGVLRSVLGQRVTSVLAAPPALEGRESARQLGK